MARAIASAPLVPRDRKGSSEYSITDEFASMAEVIDKLWEYKKPQEATASANMQMSLAAQSPVSTKVLQSILNDLFSAAGEAGIYGLLFKMIILIKQRVDKAQEVEEKAKLVHRHSFHIWRCYESMRSRFACSAEYGHEQESTTVVEEIENEAVLLFIECVQILGRISNAPRTRSFSWKFCTDKLMSPFHRCLSAPDALESLNDCIEKLETFYSALLMHDLSRAGNNVLPYLGGKLTVGQEFKESITALKAFMESAAKEGNLSVVHLTGTQGVGKSRLAKEILHKMFSKSAPDEEGRHTIKIELLQIDCSSSSSYQMGPIQCQRQLIEQIADSRAAEGLSCMAVGKTKIRSALRTWKDVNARSGQKRKVVLSLDNVPFGSSLLEDILPDDLSECLPSGSGVIVSMKGDDVDGERGYLHDQIRKIFKGPKCRHRLHKVKELKYKDARELFELYSRGPQDTDEKTKEDVLHEMVKRCEGNPLLLTTVGGFFNSRQPRTLSFWKEVLKVLGSGDVNPKILSDLHREHVSKQLNDSTKNLQDIEKMFTPIMAKLEAFYKMNLRVLATDGEEINATTDIANIFNGWSKRAVESILGEDILKKLSASDPKFISFKKILLENSLRGGEHGWVDAAHLINHSGHGSAQLKVVKASSEFKDTARNIYGERYVCAVNSPLPKLFSHLTKKATKHVRSLFLIDCEGRFEMGWLDKIQGLHYLILYNLDRRGITVMVQKDLRYLYWGSDKPESMSGPRFPFESANLPSLKTLVLAGLDFDAEQEFKIPMNLQHLTLIRCRNVQLISESIFQSRLLRSLHLQECENLCKLTEINQWIGTNPFCLSFQGCADMECIPAFINRLHRLTELQFISCQGLRGRELTQEQVLELSHDRPALKSVSFEDCKNLTCFPGELILYTKSIRTLEFKSCRMKLLSPEIALFQNLERLTLQNCVSLQALPSQIGDLVSLKCLYIEGCRGLESLPNELGKLQSLTKLQMDYCTGLKTLPVELQDLKSLRSLSMQFCNGFEPSTSLPDLGNLGSLQYVNIAGLEPLSMRQKLFDSCASLRGKCQVISDLRNRTRYYNPKFSSDLPTRGKKPVLGVKTFRSAHA